MFMVASKKLSPMDRLASSVDVDVYIDSDRDSDVAIDMFKTV